MTEHDRIADYDKKIFAKLYAEKLFKHKVISEDYRDFIQENPSTILVSYNPQQNVIEFRANTRDALFPFNYDAVEDREEMTKDLNESFFHVHWPRVKSKNTPFIIDRIECDFGEKIITMEVDDLYEN